MAANGTDFPRVGESGSGTGSLGAKEMGSQKEKEDEQLAPSEETKAR